MKFRNPWIDPRITELRPEAVEEYLFARGWKRVGPSVFLRNSPFSFRRSLADRRPFLFKVVFRAIDPSFPYCFLLIPILSFFLLIGSPGSVHPHPPPFCSNKMFGIEKGQVILSCSSSFRPLQSPHATHRP
jgi:hypothetical protein